MQTLTACLKRGNVVSKVESAKRRLVKRRQLLTKKCNCTTQMRKTWTPRTCIYTASTAENIDLYK